MTAPTETERNPNALIDETSPYLLQHAYNPVEWRPWGQTAFEEARKRNVPIFLSVGYSTCYWCHVMERESFEDESIAQQMNEQFVCIKVDREERPDVDDIYMTAVQLISGRGGWPMSVWLTPPGAAGEGDPGLKPFFAGTYYPPEPRQGMPSFPQVLGNIAEIWENSPEQIIEQADRVADAVREQVAHETDPVRVDTTQIQQALGQLIRIHDREHGGFGGAPKFPQPSFPEYLFELRDAIADPATQSTVKRALKKTLDEMATGGIYDQVGGGFHRYSTDKKWLVPHFEKMLYDNAQLVSLYALSAALTGDEYHARIVADTLNYVEREMTSDSGAFYSAQDAEVNEREGLNYLWTKEQITEALDEADASFAMTVFGLDAGTNFTDPHHPEDGPKNVLYLPDRPEELADETGMEVEAFIERLDNVRAKLYDVRQKREQPGLDDKIITSWNGLMIKAQADAALVLRSKAYLEAGQRAAQAIHEMMRREDGTLARTARNGEVGTDAVLEDYAMYASGLLALHRASSLFGDGNPDHLPRAQATIDKALELFGDGTGALYDTRAEQADLFVRTRTAHDGAMPSGQSVMLHALIDLYAITSDEAYLERAIALIGSMSRSISDSPLAMVNSVRGLHRLLAIDSSIPDRWGEPQDESRPQSEVETPVSVLTTCERVTVPKAGSVTLPIRIEIEEPYHINAHDPGVEGLEPLSVSIAGGSGVAIDVDYPEGEAYEGSAVPETMGQLKVHSGAVEFEARLSRTDEPVAGRPLIVVTYQVCSDTECFQPLTVELDVSIDFE